MGASEWKYRIECAPAESPAQVFERLQLREMAGDDYLWDDDCIGPRPRTIAQLKAGRGPEFGQQGTHSILDMYGVVAADERVLVSEPAPARVSEPGGPADPDRRHASSLSSVRPTVTVSPGSSRRPSVTRSSSTSAAM